MIARISTTLAVLAAVTALAACGGGNNSSPVPVHATSAPTASGPGPTATPTAKATAPPGTTATPTAAPTATGSLSPALTQTFVITVPAAAAPAVTATTTATGASARRRLYTSTNTQSIDIAVQSVNGRASTVAPTIAKTTAGSPGCVASASGLTCTVVANAAVGSDVFAISTYASPDGSGSALATTTIAATITAVAAAPITLSLEGVAASIGFSPAILPLVNDGAIHRYAVTVDALDASGAAIVGSSAYQSPISLQIVNDPTHALSLSTASVAAPGTVVTVTFDGSKQLAGGSIAASATGIAPVALTAAPLNFNPASLTMYDDQSGGAATTVSQSGFTGTFTATLANPADGHASITAGPLQSGSAVASVTPAVIFDVTSLAISNGSYGANLPVTILPHPGAFTAFGQHHKLLQAATLIAGPGGQLWTEDAETGSVVSFDPATATYTEYVVDPSDSGPSSIAFDSAGKLWFADGSQVGSFDPASHVVNTYTAGLAADARVISIVTGPPGTMWFYDEESNNVPAFEGSPTSFGTIATATGTIHEYTTPNAAAPAVSFESMVLGPDGALWFADAVNGAIGHVTSTGSYESYPITSAASPNLAPQTLVLAPDGNIWFGAANYGLGQGFVGTIAPATHAVATYAQGVVSGRFDSMIVGSDHNIWYSQVAGYGFLFSAQETIGVVNVSTHAASSYAAIVPQFSVIAGMVDLGDRTLYMLDSAYGQIGKVPFK